MSFHWMLRRITDFAELPNGTIYVRDENGQYRDTDTAKIPTSRLPDLKVAMAEGRVYAIWASRTVTHEEIGPEWPFHLGMQG